MAGDSLYLQRDSSVIDQFYNFILWLVNKKSEGLIEFI